MEIFSLLYLYLFLSHLYIILALLKHRPEFIFNYLCSKSACGCRTLVSSSSFCMVLDSSEHLSGMKIFSGWRRFVLGLPLIFLLTHLFSGE